MLACCLKEWWWSGLSAFCYWKSSFQGLMKKIPLFKNWVFRYSRFGFIWGALVPEVSKLGAALGVLTPYMQSPYFGDWIYRYARSWFYLLDSCLRGLVSGVILQQVPQQRFPYSGRGPYFVRTESTDVPGYGFICKALVNTLLLWVRQPAAFDTSLLPVFHLHFRCIWATCLLHTFFSDRLTWDLQGVESWAGA